MDTPLSHTPPGADLLALLQISRIVSRGDDAESRIQDILRYLAVSHRLVRGRVLIADPDAREIYVRYAHGLTPVEVGRGRYRVGEGVTGRVFETGVAVLVADVHQDPGFLARVEDRDAIPPEPIAFLAVPIVREQLPIGVLAALRRYDEECSPQSDLALMEIIGSLIAPVLCASGQSEPWVCPMSEGSRASCSPSVRSLPPVPPARVAGPAVGTGRGDLDRTSSDLMLRMAQQRHGEGRLHLAAGLYLKVVEQESGTEQAQVAVSKLMEIAHYHESKGNARLAADVLERLQRVVDGSVAAADQRSDPWGDDDSGFGPWDSFRDSRGSGGIGARVR
ncbi:GAF domain-containing protein [Candidatus Thiodictyon syntrophicum]|jgi:hypothetical protein|uniref:GAF domain-containing protein n=1 Tax=Candidatus Thiodictyon syntrophicum TaxID=1166950 RepID=A0A2K8UF53_9GAMM|nr:GAF domain-containing protein [Candidatus Thiodictyon syntrophicum]AUB84172.1 hypothetical protein THSYN_26680 [Candidatus Thiodictyon syntrophicum]